MGADDRYELAMFPLGQVLFPTLVLPLHVFEPRYRAMFSTLTQAADVDPHPGEFGVVLIERGSEVGGGERRSNLGTAAKILRAEPSADGRWMIVAVGHRRIRVIDWLDDDPWPRALVADWPDPDQAPSTTDQSVSDPSRQSGELAGIVADLSELAARVREAQSLAVEVGDLPSQADFELSEDPTLASFQLAALAPLGPFDQQRLLSTEGTRARLELLRIEIGDTTALLRARSGYNP